MSRWTQWSVKASLVVILPCSCSHPVLGTPICSCSRSLLSGENALLTLILVLPLHNSTTWSCPVVVSEPGFEARMAENPLLMGYGLAESSREGRKSQLKKASTSICLSLDWKPFYFSFALGTTRWWQEIKGWCLCNQGLFHSCLTYTGWSCSEATAEHLHMQCKSEKTEALIVSTQLEFGSNPSVSNGRLHCKIYTWSFQLPQFRDYSYLCFGCKP